MVPPFYYEQHDTATYRFANTLAKKVASSGLAETDASAATTTAAINAII
jgi:hypothetical protein